MRSVSLIIVVRGSGCLGRGSGCVGRRSGCVGRRSGCVGRGSGCVGRGSGCVGPNFLLSLSLPPYVDHRSGNKKKY